MTQLSVRSTPRRRSDVSASALIVVAALVLAACSGAAPTSSGTAAPGGGGTAPAIGGATPVGGTSTQAPTDTGTPSETQSGGTGGTAVSADAICAQIPDAAWNALQATFGGTFVKDPENVCSRKNAEGTVELNVEVEAGRDQIRAMNSACGTVVPVSGIGDEAIWCPSLKTLAVYANGQTTSIQVFNAGPSGVDDKTAIAAAQAFAAIVLPLVPKVETPTGNAGDNAACKLTTQEELKAILGEPFSPPAPDTAAGVQAACSFERLDQIGSATVRLASGTGQYDNAHAAFATDAVDVPGVGQRAFWVPGVRVLEVVCGANTLELQLVFLEQDSAKVRAGAEALAKVICPRVG